MPGTRRTVLRRLAQAAGLAALSLLPRPSQAQTESAWPARPIRLVVPGAAGSGSDLFARIIAEQLALVLRQPVIVDNKPGGSGVIGNDAVAKARPDGHTLLFSNASFTVMLQALEPRLPYDLLRDLEPVAQVGAGGVFLVVSPDVPAQSLAELLGWLRARPDRLAYATWGIGSSAHLIMESLKRRAGLDLVHVPYKSTVQIIQDRRAGVLKVAWLAVSSSMAAIRAGRIRAVAVSGSHRAPATPAVPTMREQGYPYDADGWYAMFAPAGTPPAIVRTLNREVNRILASPDLKERFMQMNFSDPPIRTPEEFSATLRRDLALWSTLAQEGAVRAE